MKLSMQMSLGLLVGTLAAPAAQASTVTKCTGVGNFGAYYVLFNEQVANATPMPPTPYYYTLTPNPFPPPVYPAEPRRYDELLMNNNEPPPFYAMCGSDIPSFETLKGIHLGDPISVRRGHESELYHVLNTDNVVVGTAWLDKMAPFDQGGAIAGQSYWRCLLGAPTPTPVVNNFAAFASGLDLDGINETKGQDKETFYLNPIRERFRTLDFKRMEVEQCFPLLTKADFLDSPNLNEAQIWYRVYDPNTGAGDTLP